MRRRGGFDRCRGEREGRHRPEGRGDVRLLLRGHVRDPDGTPRRPSSVETRRQTLASVRGPGRRKQPVLPVGPRPKPAVVGAPRSIFRGCRRRRRPSVGDLGRVRRHELVEVVLPRQDAKAETTEAGRRGRSLFGRFLGPGVTLDEDAAGVRGLVADGVNHRCRRGCRDVIRHVLASAA